MDSVVKFAYSNLGFNTAIETLNSVPQDVLTEMVSDPQEKCSALLAVYLFVLCSSYLLFLMLTSICGNYI